MADSDRDRALFMISIAAELAELHPQTLRMYERRGLIRPQRSNKRTRLYSMADVDRLRRIQELTSELGLNLAGVERVLELEGRLERAQLRVRELEEALVELSLRAEEEAELIHRSYRRELVPVPRMEIVHIARRRRS